jgi:hypothetical protein
LSSSRTEHRIRAGKARERQHGGFHADLRRPRRRQVERGQACPRSQTTCGIDEVHADRLARERDRARRARVHLEDVHRRVGDRKLDVEDPHDAERRPEPLHDVLHLERVREREGRRREHARRVAGVDARLLDVLHHRADVHLLAVAQCIDVELDRVLDEAVEEDGVRS